MSDSVVTRTRQEGGLAPLWHERRGDVPAPVTMPQPLGLVDAQNGAVSQNQCRLDLVLVLLQGWYSFALNLMGVDVRCFFEA